MYKHFNEVLSQNEKKRSLPITFGTNRLREFMDEAQVVDLGLLGLTFTWNNKRKGRHNIKQRIDKVMALLNGFTIFQMLVSIICK